MTLTRTATPQSTSNEEIGYFSVGDCQLFYRHWLPDQPTDKVIFLFHRGHEHSARLTTTVQSLQAEGDAHIIAWDARGHGASPGKRGFAPDGYATLVQDMDRFVRGMCARCGSRLDRCIIVAHSVAAVTATTWVHDHAPNIAGLVLLTPAFKVRLYVPLALPALRLLNGIRPEASISSYVRGHLLTHDQSEAQAYNDDEAICKDISNRILVEMAATAKRVVADAHTIRTPVFMVQAGRDWVVDNKTQDRFFKTLGSPIKQRRDVPDAYHAILHDTAREQICQDIWRFAAEAWQRPAQIDQELLQHGDPVNRQRHTSLSKRLPWWSAKRWIFGAMRMGLRGPACLSEGIRIGWRHGFDSGSSLDHVYRNQAKGWTPLGRLIDRVYLNAIGWRGIRTRKQHLQEALRIAAEACDEKKLRIVDIASGPGRYVMDFAAEQAGLSVEARLRDADPAGLEEGRAICQQKELHAITHESYDAFDPASYTDIAEWAHIGIVSGLYELFDDNHALRRSLAGLAKAIQANGYIIYTNQPWHPQLEFIARVLPNRERKPWVMRCRPQAEIDTLVAEAGFTKVRSWTDQWGIFTVSIARRNEAE